jgi:hypothetical protein
MPPISSPSSHGGRSGRVRPRRRVRFAQEDAVRKETEVGNARHSCAGVRWAWAGPGARARACYGKEGARLCSRRNRRQGRTRRERTAATWLRKRVQEDLVPVIRRWRQRSARARASCGEHHGRERRGRGGREQILRWILRRWAGARRRDGVDAARGETRERAACERLGGTGRPGRLY